MADSGVSHGRAKAHQETEPRGAMHNPKERGASARLPAALEAFDNQQIPVVGSRALRSAKSAGAV